MLELATDLLPLLAAGERVAVVTVAHVARSAPRGAGAAMAITSDARAIGSISGGCVEADAVALALSCLATGRGQTARFGFTDEQAYAAGLACGGSIEAVVCAQAFIMHRARRMLHIILYYYKTHMKTAALCTTPQESSPSP